MIRPFLLEDLDQILAIEAEAFPKTAFPEETFVRYAGEPSGGFVVMEVGPHIAGYILFQEDGHVLSMAVKPRFRRKGVGTALFVHAARTAPGRLWLEVRSRNQGAISFYTKLGMETAATMPDYYGDDDALVMVLRQEIWVHMRRGAKS